MIHCAEEPLLVLVADDDDDCRDSLKELLEAGFDLHFTKPVKLEKLSSKLRERAAWLRLSPQN
jgi:CheY-like chemotaxis protein